MRRLLAVVGVLLVGCADAEVGGAPGGPSESDVRRTVEVYEAVVRRLVGPDSTFGPDHEFGALFILDRAAPDAASPRGGSEGEPIPEEVQVELGVRLADLPRVEFVVDGDEVIGPPRKGSVVRDGGALLTLGTIPDGGSRVEVGASLYVGNLAGTWLTYVVERGPEGWEVTGTTGPVAVS